MYIGCMNEFKHTEFLLPWVDGRYEPNETYPYAKGCQLPVIKIH
jgi:hypothetical protein